HFNTASERSGKRENAVDQGEGAVKNHERKQRQPRPDEGENAEGDGGDPAQQQEPPVLGELVQQRSMGHGHCWIGWHDTTSVKSARAGASPAGSKFQCRPPRPSVVPPGSGLGVTMLNQNG